MGDRAPALASAVRTGIVFGLLGFAGNYWNLELFFGIDFLFGSFFVMLAALRAGTPAGLAAGLLASSCTYFLWRHPWAAIIMSAEAGVTAWLSRNNSRNLLFCNAIYWIALGAPLIFCFYHMALGMDLQTTALVMLKQPINGLFNALAAEIVFNLVAFSGRLKGRQVPFAHLMFTTLAAAVMIPSLIILVTDWRQTLERESTVIAERVKQQSEFVRTALGYWIGRHLSSIRALAQAAGELDAHRPASLQRLVETTLAVTPGFHRMGVMDRKAVSIAYAPAFDAEGQTTLGIDFSDRSYLPILRVSLEPHVSDVMPGRLPPRVPVVAVVAPMTSDGSYAGYCGGIVDLGHVEGLLRACSPSDQFQVTVLDRNHRIVASTRADLKAMQAFARRAGTTRPFGDGEVDYWIPIQESPASQWTLARQSLLIREVALDSDPSWTVIVEGSLQPLVNALTADAIKPLSSLALLSAAAVIIALGIGRLLTRSLKDLAAATGEMSRDPVAPLSLAFPRTRIAEVEHLVSHFGQMAQALGASFAGQKKLNEQLDARVRERTQDLELAHLRLSEAQRIARSGSLDLDLGSGRLVCSEGLYRIFELDPNGRGATYADLLQVVHPEDRFALRQADDECLRHKACIDLVHRLRLPDGRIKFVNRICEQFKSADGTQNRLLATFQDITERKLSEEGILAALREKDILLREIHHRVKNNMQVVSSLLNLQAQRLKDPALRTALQESRQRIHAMAMVHATLLDARSLAEIDLEAYLTSLVRQIQIVFQGPPVKISVQSDGVKLSVDHAMACGLIINELVTNALKHAFAGGKGGSVAIRAGRTADGQVELTVSDNGLGLPPNWDMATASSLGLELVAGLVKHQLSGSLIVDGHDGAAFSMRWPLSSGREKNHGD